MATTIRKIQLYNIHNVSLHIAVYKHKLQLKKSYAQKIRKTVLRCLPNVSS